MNINVAFISGNLAADPEFKELASGMKICSFRVAVGQPPSKKGDVEMTDYFKCSAFDGVAETCYKYLRKGCKVCVQGHLHTRKFTAKDGVDVRMTEIYVREIVFYGDATTPRWGVTPEIKEAVGLPVSEADLPF